MAPFDVYVKYLCFKNHFSRDNYDYFVYNKKTRASIQSFYKRRDRFFFEKISRQKNEKEVEEFFLANFVSSSDPETLWIGEIIKEGDVRYKNWQKKVQSLSYIFKEESQVLFGENKFDEVFNCAKGHPVLLKRYLTNKLSLETMVIYDKIFLYSNKFDKKLKDPIWETISRRIKKYSPFLHIDTIKYRKILKEIVVGEK